MQLHSLRSVLNPVSLCIGIAIGIAAAACTPRLWAASSGPTEHEGLNVETLFELTPETLSATVGLEGYTMRMRKIDIASGGQIAEHSHKDRPGIVTVVQGEWVEGQAKGEAKYAAASYGTFPETEETVHWVYNRNTTTSTALVCDIAKVE